MSIKPAEQPQHPASPSPSSSSSSSVVASVPASVGAALAALGEMVDVLVGLDPAELDGPGATALVGELHSQTDRLTAVYLGALPVIEADGRWALDGARTFPTWLAARLRTSPRGGPPRRAPGPALRDELPLTHQAVRTGAVTVEHARVLATTAATSDPRRAALTDPASACNETFLLTQAAMVGVDPFRGVVRRWAAAADPDADDRGYRDAADREYLDVARTVGGYHLAGFLTEEHGLPRPAPAPGHGQLRRPQRPGVRRA